MNMIRIGLNIPSLIRWAHEERSLFPSVDMDMGYLLHAAMRKAFGPLAPQPFFLIHAAAMRCWDMETLPGKP